MRYLKVLIPVILVVALGACAKPPQADIDAAKAAVAAAAQNSDIVAYAADTLKTAQDKLSQMQTELDAKHYDKVKSLALDAKAAAESAVNDAAKGKEKAQADATTLIDSLKKELPEAQKKVAAAKKIKGLKLDWKALAKQLSDAKPVLADAEKQLADGNFAVALQTASTIQAQLADGEKTIADAIAALKK
jgi:dynactin complex subunit